MEVTLIKDFISPQGREYKAGSLYFCCRDTYKKLVETGYCEALPGEKKTKKKTKKIEENGCTNNTTDS